MLYKCKLRTQCSGAVNRKRSNHVMAIIIILQLYCTWHMQIVRGHPEIMTKQEPGCLPGPGGCRHHGAGGGRGEGGGEAHLGAVTS